MERLLIRSNYIVVKSGTTLGYIQPLKSTFKQFTNNLPMTSSGFENKKPLITSVSEYINVILEKRGNIETERVVWFRGHGSTKYNLWPNLYRETLYQERRKRPTISEPSIIQSIEMDIDSSFSRKAFSFFSKRGIPDTPLYRYFLKQHYKLRTRLLDWTENALIALFFALDDQKAKEDDQKFLFWHPVS